MTKFGRRNASRPHIFGQVKGVTRPSSSPALIVQAADPASFLLGIDTGDGVMANQSSDFRVDEAGLDDGTRAGAVTTSAGGVYERPPGGQIEGFVVNGVDLTGGGSLSGDFGTLTVAVDDQGNYRWDYQLTDNSDDHRSQGRGDEGINDPFKVEVNGGSQGTQTDNLRIFVKDDVPDATATAPSSVAEGEVARGTWSVNAGADGLREMRVYVSEESGFYRLDTPIELSVGTLIVNSDGSWEFEARDGLDQTTHPELEFTLRPIDNDGDRGRVKVTVEITDANIPTTPTSDDDPYTRSPSVVLDEDGLAGGNPGGPEDVAGEAASASARLGYDFGADGPAASGAFYWTTDGLPTNLQSQGSAVVYEVSADGLSLTGRDEVSGEAVFTVVRADDSDLVTVSLLRPLDHFATGTEDDIDLSLGYVVKDADGSEAKGYLAVTVDDDTPVVVDDYSSAGSGESVNADVLANDSPGADLGHLVSAEVDSGQGQVVINDDQTLTFTPADDFSGTARIKYKVLDCDGDPMVGHWTVKVEDTDGKPVTSDVHRIVLDEDGLPGGNAGGNGDVVGEPISAVRDLQIDFGADGPAAGGGFAWSADIALTAGPQSPTDDNPRSDLDGLTSQGSEVSFEVVDGGRGLIGRNEAGESVITVSLEDGSDVARAVLHRPIDHLRPFSEDNIFLGLSYTVTDADGDTAQGQLELLIDDDTAETEDDSSVSDNGAAVTLDVLANDAVGADGGSVTAANVVGDSEVTGSVVLNQNGTLTFTPDPGQSGVATVRYTLTDGDGDPRFAEWTIIVDADGTPTTPSGDDVPVAEVDEDGLAGGIAGGIDDVAGEATQVAGVLGYDAGTDGAGDFRWLAPSPSGLTSGGMPVMFSVSGDGRQLVGSAGGSVVLTAVLTNLLTGAYQVTLAGPLDHSDPGSEDDIDLTLNYVVSDSDGDEAQGSLNVVVDDDSPLAADDAASASGGAPVVIEVLDNDQAGADGASVTAAAVRGGDSVGTVSVNTDGSLTFVPNPTFGGQAVIDYTLTDNDGDSAEAEATVSVEGPADELVVGDNDDDNEATGAGGDVLIGDRGGLEAVLTPATNYNISLIVDTTGSMVVPSGTPGLSRLELVQAALKNLLTDLVAHDGQINLQIVDFGTNAVDHIVIDLNSADDIAKVVSFIDGFRAEGGTNLEAGIRTASGWLAAQDADPRFADFEDLSFILTDGGPTHYTDDAGRTVSATAIDATAIKEAADAYTELDALSSVRAVGIGDATREDVLEFFDNTDVSGTGALSYQGTVVDGVRLANFTRGSTDALRVETWTKVSDANTVAAQFGGKLRIRDNANDDQAAEVVSTSFFVDDDPDDQLYTSLLFRYSTSVFSQSNDSMGYVVEVREGGQWQEYASSSLTYAPNWTTVDTGFLESGEYRLRFLVDSGNRTNDSLDIDQIRLEQRLLDDGDILETGQVEVVNTAEELEAALFGGGSQTELAALGDDVLAGNEGDDVLFGDTVNSDGLSWVDGDSGESFQAGEHDGLGYLGLVEFLRWGVNGGAEPTDQQIIDYVRDNVETLAIADRSDGGNDSLSGGAGDDILIGGGGDDLLVGGADGDLLVGGAGADVFAWEFGDAGSTTSPAQDTVADFTAGEYGVETEADRLDLADLLQGADEDNLEDYLQASQDGDDTLLSISSEGNLAAGGVNADQVVVLQGVQMGADGDAFLQNLLDDGQLRVE